MLRAISTLLVFQLIGEALSMWFRLPIPGPVIGMSFLFMLLVVRNTVPSELRETSQMLLQYLSLLFVPAGVGVMLHFQRIADEWVPIVIALVASTAIAIIVTALVLQALLRNSTEEA